MSQSVGEKSVDELCQLIERGDPQAVDLLASLDNPCQLSSDGRTLFDVAIASNHTAVMEILAADPATRAFAAPVDESLKTPIKHSVAHLGIEFPLAKLEQHLESSFDAGLSYGRTPLLAACRAGNEAAIALLLKAGAKTSDKDLLGLTAPALCFFSGGEAALSAFLKAFRASGQKKLNISKGLLEEALPHPELLAQILAVGSLAQPAKQLLFCYHCAHLDQHAVQRMLAEGYDLNKGISASLNPLEQACTSQLFWNHGLPESDLYAYHLKKHHGPVGSHSITVDNDLLNEDGSNIGQLMAEAECKREALVAHAKALTMSPEDEKALLARRCSMVDTLMEAGLDRELAQEKLDWDFFEELEEMGMDTLIAHLARHDVSDSDEEDTGGEALSSADWELTSETTLSAALLPLENASGLVRLTLANPYGPIDDVAIELRELGPDGTPVDDWFEVFCQREWLDINGDIVDRNALDEPVYGETPWQAVYESPLAKDSKAARLEIRLQSDEDESLNGVIGDWVLAAHA